MQDYQPRVVVPEGSQDNADFTLDEPVESENGSSIQGLDKFKLAQFFDVEDYEDFQSMDAVREIDRLLTDLDIRSIGDKLMTIAQIEQKIGATYEGARRLSKVANYLKIYIQSQNLNKELYALEQ